MSKSNKNIIMILSVSLIVIAFFGFSYAALTYTSTGTNKELIVGDIWMKYGESNQLKIDGMLPTKSLEVFPIADYVKISYNENMTSEEMNKCIEYFDNYHSFDDGETAEAYCNGTGTMYGDTIINDYNMIGFYSSIYYYIDYDDFYLLKNNIILKEVLIPGKTMVYSGVEFNSNMTESEVEECKKIEILSGNSGTEEDIEKYCRSEEPYDYNEGNLQHVINGFNQYHYDDISQHYVTTNMIKPVVNLPYFEFTISGKNTYDKDIIYDIVLSYGDNHETRTTRIKDENLQFTLVEVNSEGKVIDVFLNHQKYYDLNNNRIWVNTIPANTNEEIEKTYRLYMHVAYDTVIGNQEQDYTTEEWDDVFASIKVNVTGDFKEKEITPTAASCFSGSVRKLYKPNPNMTEDEMNKCIDYYEEYYYNGASIAKDFCEGKNTFDGYNWHKFNTSLYQDTISDYYEENINSEHYNYLISNNIILFDSNVYVIEDYDETCGNSVVIPSTINGNEVLGFVSWTDPLKDKKLINLEFPDSFKIISSNSFENNYLKKVIIPDSVEELECDKFDTLTEVITKEGFECITYHGENG